MSHQIYPKTSATSAMAGSDADEWVYLNDNEAAGVPDDGVCECSGGAADDENRGSHSYSAGAAEEEDGASDEDAYSGDDYSDYSNEGRLEKAYESDEGHDHVGESDHGTFDLTELDDYLESMTDHGKDIRKEVGGAAAPAAQAVVDAGPAACAATNEHFDGAADDDDLSIFFDSYYYDADDYHVGGASGEHYDGLAYHDRDYSYFGGGYGSSYGYGYGGVGGCYGYGGGGGYYGGGYGYPVHPYHAGLQSRVYQPCYVPGVGLYPPLPSPYELPYPYAAQPASQYGYVYIPYPLTSPMAPALSEPLP